MKKVALLILFTLLSFKLYSADDEKCHLGILETSLDGLHCEGEEGKSDCGCYAKNYAKLVPAEQRVKRLERKMGESLGAAFEQGVYEMLYSAQELSMLGFNLMESANVKSYCSLDKMAQISKGCRGGEERIQRYFGVSFDEFIKKSIFKIAQESKPLKNTNVNQCLSVGEVKTIKAKSSFDLKQGLAMGRVKKAFNTYDGNEGSILDFLDQSDYPELKEFFSLNPVLKNISKNATLSQKFVSTLKLEMQSKALDQIEFDSLIRRFLSNNNQSQFGEIVANKCRSLTEKVTQLICQDVDSVAVASDAFNRSTFSYDPEEFTPEFLEDDARDFAEFNEVDSTEVFANHIFYCQGQQRAKELKCEAQSIESKTFNTNCFVSQLEEDFGSEIFKQRTNEGESAEHKGSINNFNQSFCKVAFCTNFEEVLSKSDANCSLRNTPLQSQDLMSNIKSLVFNEKMCMSTIIPLVAPCPPGGNLTTEFEIFTKMMEEKQSLFQGTLASTSGENGQQGDSVNKKSSFEDFTDHFFGNVGKTIEQTETTGKKITFQDFQKIEPVASLQTTVPNNPAADSVAPKTVETTANNEVQAVQTKDSDARDNSAAKSETQVTEQPVAEAKPREILQRSDSQGGQTVSYEQYLKDLQTLEDIGNIREEIGRVRGEIDSIQGNNPEKEALKRWADALETREGQLSSLEDGTNAQRNVASNGAMVSPRPFRRNSPNGESNRNQTQYPPRDFRSEINRTTQRSDQVGEQQGQPEVRQDESGIANLPEETSENAGSTVAHGSASVGGAGTSGGGRSSASSTNGNSLTDLPYTGREATDRSEVKVIQVENLDGKINLAKLLRDKGISLDLGMPFKLVYEGLEVVFSPDAAGNDDVKYIYRATPSTEDADTLFSFLQQAPYWFKDRVESSGLNQQIKRLRN